MSRALSEFGSISIIAFYVTTYPFYGVSSASVTISEFYSGAVSGGLDAAVTASAAMITRRAPDSPRWPLRKEEGVRVLIDARARKDLGKFSLSAELHDGGFICLVGKNGSGKSTFLKAIAGQLRIDEGFVRLGGTDVTRLPTEKRRIVMVTPASSIAHLDVDAHLKLGAKLRKLPLDDARIVQVKTELGINFTGRARTLSLGMRERLSLATALLSSPKVILVDEAFANLHDRREFVSAYRRLAQEAGIDVVFTSQDESDASLAEHLYTIADGSTEKRS